MSSVIELTPAEGITRSFYIQYPGDFQAIQDIAVMAGTYAEYNDFIRSVEATPNVTRRYRYIRREQDLIGFRGEIVYAGNYTTNQAYMSPSHRAIMIEGPVRRSDDGVSSVTYDYNEVGVSSLSFSSSSGGSGSSSSVVSRPKKKKVVQKDWDE